MHWGSHIVRSTSTTEKQQMTDGRSGPGSGARSTRLGLVTLGFVIGVIVTVLVMFMIQNR